MSAVRERIVDLREPAKAAVEIQRLNDRLAGEATISPEIADAVREIAAGIDQTSVSQWEMVDPRHAVVVLHAAVSAQHALGDAQSPAARDQLRIALETIRQSLATIAEREPVSDERSAQEIVQWLAERTEVSQARLAALLGVSARQLQRWLSPTETARPEGDDARRVRLAARIVNQLRFVLTPSGTVDWFDWPRTDLGGRRPVELLGEASEEPALLSAAGSMRSTFAD